MAEVSARLDGPAGARGDTAAGAPALTGGVLYPVQYARAFAALAVFLYHISATVSSTFDGADVRVDAVGAAGVDLFFVVSGFIIALVVSRGGAFRPGRFLLARWWRVAPLYWFVTLALFALVATRPDLLQSTDADPWRLLRSLLFVPDDGSPILLVGWTLNYEMFFYALAALFAGLGDRRLVWLAAALAGLVLLGALVPLPGPFGFWADPIVLEFAFGIACFHLWRWSMPWRDSPLWPLLLGAGLLALLVQFEREADASRVVLWGLPAAAILLGGLHAVRFRWEWLRRLGDWSYALYLVHLFVVVGTVRHIVPWLGPLGLPWWVHYATMTAAVLALAWALHRWIERPLAQVRFQAPHLTPRRAASRPPSGGGGR